MDAVTRLHRQLVDYSNSLFQEGILDNQFGHLQQLQDESNPDFVAEVVNLYFKDSERLLNEITVALDQQNVDFTKVGGHVHQLKGSSSRFIFLHFIDLIESKIIVFFYPILYLYIVTA
ncbi:hypothetical protein CISIN_1g031698mg [Citrus sinensis]|uniref:Histidine-containing phosphotransfer protein n=1 Tax=Citrus sinensis TaxID=2711 RepID=A0A067E076_CITSI|nr:hypothetical protein CISIN_1g031698mg [Citrus sinensis]